MLFVHDIPHKKVLFFWLPKCGSTSILELIVKMHFNKIISSSFTENQDELIHLAYSTDYESPTSKVRNYSNYKIIFFGRNPYHRILSLFLDKYACFKSPTPKPVPPAENYHQFVKHLWQIGVNNSEHIEGICSKEFCFIKDENFLLYTKYRNNPISEIIMLPPTAVPEGRLVHDFRDIKRILNITQTQWAYSGRLQNLFEKNIYSPSKFKWDVSMTKPGADIIHKKDLMTFRDRTIDYNSFYPPEVKKMFDETYGEEFDFYEEMGYSFEP